MKLIDHLVHWRNRYFLLTLLVLLVSSSQLLHMAFNGDIKVMFDRNDPYMVRLQAFDQTYQQSQYLMIMIEPADRQIFTPANIALARELTAAAWQLPHVIRVDSLTNFPRIHSDTGGVSIDTMVSEAGPLEPEAVASIRSYASTDSQVHGKLVSAQENAAALVLTLAFPDSHLDGVLALNRAAAELKQDFTSRYPGLVMHFHGDAAIEHAVVQVTMDDMMRVNPVVFLTIFLLAGCFLRSLVAVAATVAVVVASTGISTGLLVRLGFDMNPITMMAPAIIMVLAVADSIHILTQYILYRRDGMDSVRAISLSLKRNLRPVFWTSATTAVGFLGMNFGDSPPFRDMGNMAAVGVLVAFVTTYTVLPAVTLFLPGKVASSPLALTQWLEKLSALVVRGSSWLLGGFLALIVLLALQIPRMEVNDDLSEYFDESLDIYQSTRFARANLEGVEYILYSLDAGGEGQVNDPAFLHKVERFSDWLRQQPEVSSVESYADLLKRINRAMNDGDERALVLPETRELAAQYLLLYEMSLPEGMDTTRDISRDRASLRMMVNIVDSDNKTLIAIERRADRWLAENMPELNAQATSQLLMFAHLGTSIIYSMVDGSLFTLVFITIMMGIALRSARYGLLSIIPNICPPIVVYGVWALLVGQVNHAAAMTFSICLGLVVDDTIHLLSKYQDARRQGCSAEAAVREAFVTSGTAVVITSLTLACGILLLGLSHFTVNDTMSVMLASIIMTALVFDLVFLPVLLITCDRVWNRSGWRALFKVNSHAP